MTCQKLDYDEVLSIRWAHDDPNPVAKDSIERADKDAMVALLRAKGISLTPAGFNYPAEYHLPDSKRLKLEDGGSVVDQHPELAYPDTAGQYAAYYSAIANSANATDASSSSSSTLPWSGYAAVINSPESTTADEKKSALARLGLLDQTVSVPDVAKAVTESNKSDENASQEEDDKAEEPNQASEEEEESDGEGGWEQFTDESTGAVYFFNTATGESSWTEPEGYSSTKPKKD
jgi:hypothetical protein